MKLYFGPTSPFVRKVRIFAEELGLSDQIQCIRSPVGMLRPNPIVLQANPLGKIPTLVLDDGSVLFESDLICEYLDTLHSGPRLIPEHSNARWDTLRWNAAASGGLSTLVLWHNERLRSDAQRSEALIEVFRLKTLTTLDWLSSQVEKLADTQFGLGHISIGCFLGYLDFRLSFFNWRDRLPVLDTWETSFSARRSAQLTQPKTDDFSGVTPPFQSGPAT